MKKIVAIALSLLLLCSLTAAMAWETPVTVKVGLVGTTNEMWTEALYNKLLKEGITLEFTYFNDYSMPNINLALGEIDMNAFQHYDYLAKWQKENGDDYDCTLVPLGETLIAPLSLYSKKYTSLDEIKEGDTIAIMNDATNEARALRMLEAAGLIKLSPDITEFATALDVIENPKNLKLYELAADMISTQLDDPQVAVGFLNGQYASQAGFTNEDALITEQYSPDNAEQQGIVNIIAVRESDLENELFKYIAEQYQCDEVKEVFETLYKGTYLAAWE